MNASLDRLMLRFVDEVLNDTNPSALPELVHEDYTYRSPGEELHGRQGLAALLHGYRAAFPDLEIQPDEVIVSEDTTILAFTMTGTHRGDLLGHAPTGRPIRVHGMVRSRFRDGRIFDEWEIVDQLTMFEQLGLIRSVP